MMVNGSPQRGADGERLSVIKVVGDDDTLDDIGDDRGQRPAMHPNRDQGRIPNPTPTDGAIGSGEAGR
jgi:hypothetical protein